MMDNDDLKRDLSKYDEELVSHGISWRMTGEMFNEAKDLWHDESAKRFISEYLEQMEMVTEKFAGSMREQKSLLELLLSHFNDIEEEKKKIHRHLDMFETLEEEASDLIATGNHQLCLAKDEKDQAMKNMNKAIEISKQIV